MNGIIILLDILQVFPNPKITITKMIEIIIQLLSYCLFLVNIL